MLLLHCEKNGNSFKTYQKHTRNCLTFLKSLTISNEKNTEIVLNSVKQNDRRFLDLLNVFWIILHLRS